ncbi:MAG: Rrf2 family transcriptional regulator [Geothrix sp.]|nr:Rrf2 family transcriptional regulator [Geothrix sp.]
MISKTSEYALRAMVFLAEHPASSSPLLTIAAATQVPSGYLSKVLQQLVRAGLLTSQRGLGGGFSLARPASELSVYEVVQAVDPVSRILECPLKLPEHREELCTLHRRLDDVMEMVEHSFRLTSLADLLKKPTFPKVLDPKKAAESESPAG